MLNSTARFRRAYRWTGIPTTHALPSEARVSIRGTDGLDTPYYFYDSGNMESSGALAALAALAQEHRLTLFRLLVQAGDSGLSVGELGEATGLPGATLTNHLHILRRAGLVNDERQGRVIRCRANYGQMNDLLGYLTENCCAGSPSATCAPGTACVPIRSTP